MGTIQIVGADTHNLANVSVEIPINQITCIIGPSGSGKSSLAFHTLYQESKRRFVNSFPNYLKFFSDRPTAPKVEEIKPVLPAFALAQHNPVIGARPTVYDYLGISEKIHRLFYYYGKSFCSKHGIELKLHTIENEIETFAHEHHEVYIIVPRKYYPSGMQPLRSWYENEQIIRDLNEDDEWVELARFKNNQTLKQKLQELHLVLFEEILIFSKTNNVTKKIKKDDFTSAHCPICREAGPTNFSLKSFSSYNPVGACSECQGFGYLLHYDEKKLINENRSVEDGGVAIFQFGPFKSENDVLIREMKKLKISTTTPIKNLGPDFKQLVHNGSRNFEGINGCLRYLESKKYKPQIRIYMRSIQREDQCPSCFGGRVDDKIQNIGVKINDKVILFKTILNKEVGQWREIFQGDEFDEQFNSWIKDISKVAEMAQNLGLAHLMPLRRIRTLSPGEYQRLLLMKLFNYKGTGALFVLDEPSVGLSVEEQAKVLDSLFKLKEQGNTIVLVEHSSFMIGKSDYVIEMGPGAGKLGGKVIYEGKALKQKKSTNKKIEFPLAIAGKIEAKKISKWNKDYPAISLPIGNLVLITGPSGSGKTTCVLDGLLNQVSQHLNGTGLVPQAAQVEGLTFSGKIKAIKVLQAEKSKANSRSTVGSITGFAGVLRSHFLKSPLIKPMGLKEGHLSPNSLLGQCPICEGSGSRVIEMQFLEDIVLECDYCSGKRLRPEFAKLMVDGIYLFEAYERPLNEVLQNIKLTPKFLRIWKYMTLLKLEHLSLERTLESLSGGEKQRLMFLNLLNEASLEDNLLYIENLSFGLSETELYPMIELIRDLVQQKTTIWLVDQHPIFKTCAHYSWHFPS